MSTALTIILMAKYPEAGHVKSRLVQSGAFSIDDAAHIARLMLETQFSRLGRFAESVAGRLVVSVSPDGMTDRMIFESGRRTNSRHCAFRPQGSGTLGDRMLRAWNEVGPGPVAFFGMDCPDLPMEHLHQILAGLKRRDLAIGPTTDGGYWTIAGTEPHPFVCTGIPWGTDAVFETTIARASDANLSVTVLPEWHDVDRPEDVAALIKRLSRRCNLGVTDQFEQQLLKELTVLDRSTQPTNADSTGV